MNRHGKRETAVNPMVASALDGFSRRRFFPFLLAAFPALSLAAGNAREIAVADVFRAVALSLLGAALIYLLFRVLMRDGTRAAFATAWIVLLFFTYGHVYGFLRSAQVVGEPLGRHRYLIPLFIALAASGLWLAYSKTQRLSQLTPTLNVVSAVLVLVPALRLTANALLEASNDHTLAAQPRQALILTSPERAQLPDIYYIILDGYGRNDIMLEAYGYDNSGFLHELQDMGFYVANDSDSNYSYTILSLASSLNYSYLQDLGVELSPGQIGSDWAKLTPLIKNSLIRRDLASLGYSMIAFETGYRPTSVTDADLYLYPSSTLRGALRWKALLATTPFEAMLIDTTALKTLRDGGVVLSRLLSPAIRVPYERHRLRILFQLESLKQIPELEGPKFIFAHIVAPHEPYVFGPNGEPRTPEEVFTLADQEGEDGEGSDRKGYVDQVMFVNGQVVDVLKTILRESATPPIIILQADHGLPVSDVSRAGRMAILNAYYLPKESQADLYAGISPVNSFRIVLNGIFGAGLPLLEDAAYFSRSSNLFDMTRIDDQ